MKNRFHTDRRTLPFLTALACAAILAIAGGCSDKLPPPSAPDTDDSFTQFRILVTRPDSQNVAAFELTLPDGIYHRISSGEIKHYEPHCRKMLLVPQSAQPGTIQISALAGDDPVLLSPVTQRESMLGAAYAAISPYGTKAAYITRHTNGNKPDTIHLRVVDPKAPVASAVDSPPLLWGPPDRLGVTMPAFSPDGRTIAVFGSAVGALGPPSILCLIDAANPQQIRSGQISDHDGDTWFAEQLAESEDSSPPELSWSPDGSRIAFIGRSQSRGQFQVVVIDVNSYSSSDQSFRVAGMTNEVYGSTHVHFCWSPDGTKLAVTASSSGDGKSDLWIFDPISEHMTQLTDTPNEEELFPRWSADGSRIYYIVGHEPLRKSPGQLRAIDLSGTPYRTQTIADSVISAFPE